MVAWVCSTLVSVWSVMSWRWHFDLSPPQTITTLRNNTPVLTILKHIHWYSCDVCLELPWSRESEWQWLEWLVVEEHVVRSHTTSSKHFPFHYNSWKLHVLNSQSLYFPNGANRRRLSIQILGLWLRVESISVSTVYLYFSICDIFYEWVYIFAGNEQWKYWNF